MVFIVCERVTLIKGLITEVLNRPSVSFQTFRGRKMDLHKFSPCKYVANHVKRKSWARIVNATFVNQKHGIVNMEANVAFNIFAPDLLLSYYIFATYRSAESKFEEILFSSSDIQYSDSIF